MNNTITLNIVNKNIRKEYPAGISIQQVMDDLYPEQELPFIAALVNNRNRSLSYPLYFSKRVEFLDASTSTGHRTYRVSLAFVMYKAVKDLYPEAVLRIEHAISGGYYCYVKLEGHSNKDMAAPIKEKMQEIIDANIPFEYHSEDSNEVLEMFKESKLCDKYNLLKDKGDIYTTYYSLEDTIDTFYSSMVPSTGYLQLFDLHVYNGGLLLTVPKRSNPLELAPVVEQPKLLEVFTEFAGWNRTLKVSNVADINAKSKSADVSNLIMLAEALQEKKVIKITEMITEHKEVKIILVAGPSSSGKTTFSKRLALQLKLAGIKPVNISLDDYYVDRDKSPIDENGEYDFEHIEALDLPLLNEQLQALLDGKKVVLPKYSFTSGRSLNEDDPTQLHDNEVLVVEGIHALNPQLTKLISNNVKFKIYVSALTTISLDNHNYIPTSDNRLIRRIVRDYNYRGTSAEDNINRWESVRRGEDKWIYPYQEEANAMFNSSLLFELAVLKPYIEPMLKEVKHNCDAYVEARRLLKFLSYIKCINGRKIPPTSLLREFLGGSSFKY